MQTWGNAGECKSEQQITPHNSRRGKSEKYKLGPILQVTNEKIIGAQKLLGEGGNGKKMLRKQ